MIVSYGWRVLHMVDNPPYLLLVLRVGSMGILMRVTKVAYLL